MRPPDQTAFVNTSGTGNIDLGNNFSAISFNNSRPFSFEVYVRLRQLPASAAASVLRKTGEFVIGCTSGGNITVWRAGLFATLVSSATIAANQWIHIGVTFDGQTLTLYLNGIQDSFVIVTAAGIPNQGNDFQLGIGANMDIDTCRMWSIAQTSAYMYKAPWAPEPAAQTTGLVANYDLSAKPPKDISGNNNPLTLTAPATSILSAPGVFMSASAHVDPREQDVIRCGDTPYTIDAWLYLTATAGAQGIFSSGNLNDPGTVALWLDGGVLKSQRGPTVLAATGSIPAQTWTHVATTYNGTTLIVYINGVAAGSMATGAILSLVDESAEIGAFDTAGGGEANFFQGYIQYLSAWSIALTAAQVQSLMYDDPTLQPGCVANFSFAQTIPVDLNTGAPLVLNGGAVLAEQMVPWSPSAQPVTARSPLVFSDITRERHLRRQLRKADATVRGLCQRRKKADPPPPWEAHIPLLLAELKAAFPENFSAEERSRILKEHEEYLNQLGAEGPPPIGAVTHAIVDGDHVLTYHGPNGPEEVFRASVGDVDPCTVWWVQFIITILFGLASMLGLTAPVTARVNQFAQTLLANIGVMAAISQVFVGTITAGAVLSFLALLYNNGYLGTFFKFCFTQLTWWGIGRLVLYVVGLFIPAPSPAKVAFFVTAAALVFNLTQALQNKPC
jgi:Concanavalin A-like lectin/glucanases superfamily